MLKKKPFGTFIPYNIFTYKTKEMIITKAPVTSGYEGNPSGNAPKNSQVFWQIQLRSFHHLEEGVGDSAVFCFFFGGFSTWKCIPLKTQVHGEFKWKMVNEDDIIVSFFMKHFFFKSLTFY